MWVRDIFLRRWEQVDYENLVREMRLGDQFKHFNYFRMSPDKFDSLLSKVKNRIAKQNIILGISETCQAIWDSLWQDVLEPPTTEKWKEIAAGFNNSWQIPNCVGAVDGKHVVIQAPPNSGSEFYNYKGSHSISLMALCDHRYRFTLVDIGARGRKSDGGIFRNSEMGRKLINNELNFPADFPIEYGGDNIPFYIVGDEAFPLSNNLMRPYPGRFLSQGKRIFNYRLSRARRITENTFGIWAARWRILRRPINASLDTTERIIKATICLHNYLISNESEQYCPTNFIGNEDNDGNVINGQWREGGIPNNVVNARRLGINNATRNAAVIRDQLASYFMFEGAVPFQWNK
ncbi:hypothetical protein NQ314_012678 [Rhamnusium bicolor]|uniref:DDE Tnp4 domain-containing protein n=1 Tax=Rhamnusium bicolor TaxID=1586634 RepID=A0AAV8XB47_9CUCU|nr:hypothetical protein NQ314_012678 [Rhamnusium bicolor]